MAKLTLALLLVFLLGLVSCGKDTNERKAAPAKPLYVVVKDDGRFAYSASFDKSMDKFATEDYVLSRSFDWQPIYTDQVISDHNGGFTHLQAGSENFVEYPEDFTEPSFPTEQVKYQGAFQPLYGGESHSDCSVPMGYQGYQGYCGGEALEYSHVYPIAPMHTTQFSDYVNFAFQPVDLEGAKLKYLDPVHYFMDGEDYYYVYKRWWLDESQR
jgi:hypothetical protein